MLNQDYTAKVLDLEEVIIKDVKKGSEGLPVHIEMPRKEHICPCCGASTDRIHDYREQIVKDIPRGQPVLLHLRKRRYRCSCGKRFYEQVPFVPKYYRITQRLFLAVVEAFRELTSAARIASSYHLSVTTVLRYFDWMKYSRMKLPRVLSIDEFEGNAGGHKYQTILTDPENNKVLDILPNRYESHLIDFFKQFPDRTRVEYFITDMNPHFRRVAQVCFPKAVIVADKFHVARQAVWAMERVRKEEQKKLPDILRKRFKRSRYLLNKDSGGLTETEMDALAAMFEISPRLADAYRLKNKFIEIMRSKSSKEGKPLLIDWLFTVEVMGQAEFAPCVTACRNWFQEILNAMDAPWTNGFTEGCNNKTKVLKRVCFGVQNFARFRNRILHLSAGCGKI